MTNVPASYGRVDLARGECLTSLPLGGGEWYHLRYRLDDNFKSDGLWERHGLGDKMRSVSHARLLELRRPRTVRVTAPVREGEPVGTLTVRQGGQTVAQLPVLAAREIPRIGFRGILLRLAGSLVGF